MTQEEFCDEFMLVDLRDKDNCLKATKDCADVYNLAADMGGMGFIQVRRGMRLRGFSVILAVRWDFVMPTCNVGSCAFYWAKTDSPLHRGVLPPGLVLHSRFVPICHLTQSNHSVILYNNAMISFNMIEAARLNDVKRFYYASSACIYPEGRQLDTKNPGLKEADAWPAQPQDAYGLEKLASEELAIHYGKDFGMETRVGRFQYVTMLVFSSNALWLLCSVRLRSRGQVFFDVTIPMMPMTNAQYLRAVRSWLCVSCALLFLVFTATSTGLRARGRAAVRRRPPLSAGSAWCPTRSSRCGETASRPAPSATSMTLWRVSSG